MNSEYYLVDNKLCVLYERNCKATILINLDNNEILAYTSNYPMKKINVSVPEDLRKLYIQLQNIKK